MQAPRPKAARWKAAQAGRACAARVACRLDAVMGSTFVRDAVVIGFICNETISIIENAGLMGLPIPAAITKAVDILKQRSETEQKG